MITLPTSLAEMKDNDSVFFIDLYVLRLMSGTIYFAACDVDIDWYIPNTTTKVKYIAQPIEREQLKQSVDSKVDNVTVRISNISEAFTSALFQSFDFRGSDIDIYQIAYPDSLTIPGAYKLVFSGYIDAPVLDMSKATFEASLKAKIPNLESYRSVMKSCNAWFGDADECGVTQIHLNGVTTSGTTQYKIYSNIFTQESDYWKSGTVTIGYETKKIIKSEVGWIEVEYPFFTAPAIGASFTVVTGCDKTQPDCRRWDNLENYSGFPAICLEYQIRT